MSLLLHVGVASRLSLLGRVQPISVWAGQKRYERSTIWTCGSNGTKFTYDA